MGSEMGACSHCSALARAHPTPVSLSAAELFLNEKINIDVNARFFTPLHMAANSGHSQVVHILLQAASLKPVLDGSASSDCTRLDLMARDCMGRTTLHYAAREGHEGVVQQLLDRADEIQSNIASIADCDGLLPLHMAARSGHVGCIRILKTGYAGDIHRKAEDSLKLKQRVEWEYMQSPNSTEANVYSGEDCRFPQSRLIDSFFWRTADFTPLHFAERYGHEAAVNELQVVKEGNVDLHMEVHQGQAILPCAPVNKGKAVLTFAEDHVGLDREASSSICRSSKDIEEEKKALEELQPALAKGTCTPLRMHIVQRLEDKEIGSVIKVWLTDAVKKGNMDSLKRLLRTFANFKQLLLRSIQRTVLMNVWLFKEML